MSNYSNNNVVQVIAHPGHEILVYHWLSLANPSVWILTDGSGKSSQSRIPFTSKILKTQGAEPGELYGHFSDGIIYSKILAHDHYFFLLIAEKLYQYCINQKVTTIVGDAAEGYNPTHDICRLLINAVVKKIYCNHQLLIQNYDFVLTENPNKKTDYHVLRFELNEVIYAQKLEMARNYLPLFGEIESAIKHWGQEVFRVECLRAVISEDILPYYQLPFYEQYGEQQVRLGYYHEVIRYQQHLVPLKQVLLNWSEENSRDKTTAHTNY
jgi:hypothetical protein